MKNDHSSCGVVEFKRIDTTPNKPPSAKSLISVIAFEYGVTTDLAADWLAIRAPEFLKQEA